MPLRDATFSRYKTWEDSLSLRGHSMRKRHTRRLPASRKNFNSFKETEPRRVRTGVSPAPTSTTRNPKRTTWRMLSRDRKPRRVKLLSSKTKSHKWRDKDWTMEPTWLDPLVLCLNQTLTMFPLRDMALVCRIWWEAVSRTTIMMILGLASSANLTPEVEQALW